jgi:uncharacterized protein YhfF
MLGMRETYDLAALPRGEYAFPGPLRDRLVAAILNGSKTSTASLEDEYLREGEPLPAVGDMEAVVGSDGRPVCVTRNTEVTVRRIADVSDDHARREGEGYLDAVQWRDGHEQFWTSPDYLAYAGQHPDSINDGTRVVCVTFEVVQRV